MFINILIADDHALLRQGIRKVLELEPDFSVVGEAGDGEETLRRVKELKPDVVLLDINMPRLNGLEVAKRMKQEQINSKILILTIHDDESYVVEVIRAGAAGYLLKDVEPRMLVQAIRCVQAGESFIYPTLAKRLFNQINQTTKVSRVTDKPAESTDLNKEEQLTGREREILRLICQGMSNQVIAHQLYISEKTVKNHLTNIFRKINVSDRTQAVLYALKNKIAELGEG
ncbi:hypothetical protein P22_0520 [Propionispora sp. 2/2-37]|uniref:response regulator n=1 Tax=Propionispora sp. 2/2-37 TaxID=1677858 RepID=UPI0006BB7C5D|nr:response regulator transcription factor [Propionispora sp. 2/2-37]CUH94454.1 hypothetical protein P22_0520 [Propionispora sp. 2/2-37]